MDSELDRPITPDDAAHFQAMLGEPLTCYSCEEPFTDGAWIMMDPYTAYSWCAECLEGK